MYLIFDAKRLNSIMQTFDPTKELITITPSAQVHFKQVVEEGTAHGIRLKLTGGGCAGFAYEWEMVEDTSSVRLDEFTIAFEGWSFYLDNMSKPYLVGSTVDKKTSIAGNMIEISSPLAESTCGCGESVTFNV
ncbi:iron-sulfur cluster assembly accessory protein [bacterium]|nr:iron-sulfur cluster assembly accessory protein [bacterium]